MPWYWTDDLARTLIDNGQAEPGRVSRWISSPVAIRRDDEDAVTVAGALLDDEEGDPSSTWALAA